MEPLSALAPILVEDFFLSGTEEKHWGAPFSSGEMGGGTRMQGHLNQEPPSEDSGTEATGKSNNFQGRKIFGTRNEVSGRRVRKLHGEDARKERK